MATYNEIHPNMSGDNHNVLYMVVGIILALMIAGFAFYYYTDGSSADMTTDSAGTVVERVIEPATGDNDATSETNSMNLSVDDDGVSATTSTTNQSNY